MALSNHLGAGPRQHDELQLQRPPERDPQLFLLRGGRRAWGAINTPLADPDFSLQLEQLQKLALSATSFLDVGCGRGLIMAYMKELNPRIKVTGIDVQTEMLHQASQFGEVRRVDALKYRDYGNHDLIYLYRPLVDHREQLTLENFIISEMRVGATLISLLPAHHRLCQPKERGWYTKSHTPC